jgi:hypothetical protein
MIIEKSSLEKHINLPVCHDAQDGQESVNLHIHAPHCPKHSGEHAYTYILKSKL